MTVPVAEAVERAGSFLLVGLPLVVLVSLLAMLLSDVVAGWAETADELLAFFLLAWPLVSLVDSFVLTDVPDALVFDFLRGGGGGGVSSASSSSSSEITIDTIDGLLLDV